MSGGEARQDGFREAVPGELGRAGTGGPSEAGEQRSVFGKPRHGLYRRSNALRSPVAGFTTPSRREVPACPRLAAVPSRSGVCRAHACLSRLGAKKRWKTPAKGSAGAAASRQVAASPA